MKVWRQGDVIIKLVDDYSSEFKHEKQDMILAHGEVTGHAHRIIKGDAKLYADRAVTEALRNENFNRLILEITKDAELFHEEHESIMLPPGKYEITIQNEFDWFTQEIRKVAD